MSLALAEGGPSITFITFHGSIEPGTTDLLSATSDRAAGHKGLSEKGIKVNEVRAGAIVLPSAALVNPGDTVLPPAVTLSSSKHCDRISSGCPGSSLNPSDMTATLCKACGL